VCCLKSLQKSVAVLCLTSPRDSNTLRDTDVGIGDRKVDAPNRPFDGVEDVIRK